MQQKLIGCVSTLALLASPLFAGSVPSIGVATTIGTVSVNQTVVSGHTDLANGAWLETAAVPTDVHMASGTDLRLATRSTGAFFSDHVSLEQGAVRVDHFNGLTVDAAQLQITSDEPGSQAVVRVSKKTVEVASVGGAVNVMDGGMLTRVAAGSKVSFQQSGATPSQTGANAAPVKSKMPPDKKTAILIMSVVAVGGLAVGLTAAAQGKSPFH
jgi:hypothetical protein